MYHIFNGQSVRQSWEKWSVQINVTFTKSLNINCPLISSCSIQNSSDCLTHTPFKALLACFPYLQLKVN